MRWYRRAIDDDRRRRRVGFARYKETPTGRLRHARDQVIRPSSLPAPNATENVQIQTAVWFFGQVERDDPSNGSPL
jgi:hypothetical protein